MRDELRREISETKAAAATAGDMSESVQMLLVKFATEDWDYEIVGLLWLGLGLVLDVSAPLFG